VGLTVASRSPRQGVSARRPRSCAWSSSASGGWLMSSSSTCGRRS
jgi:hypothetical protein